MLQHLEPVETLRHFVTMLQHLDPVETPWHFVATPRHLDPTAQTPAPSGHALHEPKIKEPEMFSGHNPSKLYGFLTHCKMAFQSQPLQFMLESTHIIWAGSYLTDTA